MSRSSQQFSSIKTEGGLLPQDMLGRIQAGDPRFGFLQSRAGGGFPGGDGFLGFAHRVEPIARGGQGGTRSLDPLAHIIAGAGRRKCIFGRLCLNRGLFQPLGDTGATILTILQLPFECRLARFIRCYGLGQARHILL